MIMNSLLLFIFIVGHSLSPRFCRAQGNRTSPSNPCEASGKCGPFGVCNLQKSPICSCLRGFQPRDNREWDSGNWSGGCVRRVPLNCQGRSNGGREDGFLKLPIMMMSGSERWIGPGSECEGRCLRNCSCLVYGIDNTGCGFWSGPLIDIQTYPSGSASNLYVRVANSELDHKKELKKIIIIPVVAGSVIIFIITYFSWKCIAKERAKNKAHELVKAGVSGEADASLQDALSKVNVEDLPLYKFEILSNATTNFSEANKLGRGGFGPVYKGELANGKEIAVKRLSQASQQGVQELLNEVLLISKLQHRNLVRLLGCCIENNEAMLIYEYMPNKSLDFFLFDPLQEILDWRKRFNIIEGVCRGLLYLHRDSRLKIIHRDLKPSNILLANDWNPKISDFGMARIFGTKQDHVRTIRVVGTYGYMAPEYAMEGRFSEKSDVFSFGVLMLEIATGRRNTSFYKHDVFFNLLGYVWKLWQAGNVVASVDPRISSPVYQAEVARCIHIGLLCVQQLAMDRPSISAVLSMLCSETIELPKPKKPAFVLESSNPDSFCTSSSQQSQNSSASMNAVTVTTVVGR